MYGAGIYGALGALSRDVRTKLEILGIDEYTAV